MSKVKHILIIIALFLVKNISAQCAMCKAVITNGNDSMAKSVNSGIEYLMIFPYILVAILFYFLYKHTKKIIKK